VAFYRLSSSNVHFDPRFPSAVRSPIILVSQPGETGMTTADIVARVKRLDQLSRGLAKEIQLVEKADDPMLYVERRKYLTAMRKVQEGVENALGILAKAKRRIVR
jgi:hypothetical protein